MTRLLPLLGAVAAAAFAAAAAPAPTSAPAPAARALKYPILGTWEFTKYVLAPWIEADEDTKAITAEADKHLHLQITFAANKVVSADTVLGCTQANFEPTSFPPDYLFQGGLPEGQQAKLAASYGLPPGEVPGFDLDCSTGLFSYHFANADTLLLGYDDAIYWIERKK